MEQFVLGQKWLMSDAIYGNFIGEVVEVSDHGASGAVVITDERGNIVDTFVGSAAAFQASGEWQLISVKVG
jgi:hypothetical protein